MARVPLVFEDVLDHAQQPDRTEGYAQLLHELAPQGGLRGFAELDATTDCAMKDLTFDGVFAIQHEDVAVASGETDGDVTDSWHMRSLDRPE